MQKSVSAPKCPVLWNLFLILSFLEFWSLNLSIPVVIWKIISKKRNRICSPCMKTQMSFEWCLTESPGFAIVLVERRAG